MKLNGAVLPPPPLGAALAAEIRGLQALRVDAELAVESLDQTAHDAMGTMYVGLQKSVAHIAAAAHAKHLPEVAYTTAAAEAQRVFASKHTSTALEHLRRGDATAATELLERLVAALATIKIQPGT